MFCGWQEVILISEAITYCLSTNLTLETVTANIQILYNKILIWVVFFTTLTWLINSGKF